MTPNAMWTRRAVEFAVKTVLYAIAIGLPWVIG